MKAMISGRAGVALLMDNGKYWSVSVEEPDLRTPCAVEEFHGLLSGADDLVATDSTTFEKVQADLRQAWARDRALQMLLFLLDREEDDEIRQMAAECLEERLTESSTGEFLLNRLCEAPLPNQADISGAIRLVAGGTLSRTATLLAEINKLQQAVAAVCDSFESLDDGFVLSDEFPSRALLRRWLADQGVFRRLALVHGAMIGNEVLALLANPVVRRLPGASKLLTAWTAPLKKPLPELSPSCPDGETSQKQPVRSAARIQRSNHESWQLAERQVGEILGLFDNSEDAKALQWADDLVKRQIREGAGANAVQSLSKLAIGMKQRGRTGLQLHFAKQAAQSDHADAQARCQYADALLRNNDPIAALSEYEQTIGQFGNDVVARNGRAEVLRELNRYEEALRQYEQTIGQFGNNIIARNGRAEVLRELNRYEEALLQYEETIRQFGNNVVAQCGRAEVLRELNRCEEALRQYEETIGQFGNDAFARNGRAEVLRELNRYEEALRQYEETIRQFGNDVVAQCGRAEVLRELYRREDALRQYEQTIDQFGNDVVAQCGRADVLREMNRRDEALQQIEETIRLFPINRIARRSCAVILMELERYDDALEKLAPLEQANPTDWIALHVRGMILLRKGWLEQAAAVFMRGVEGCPVPRQQAYFRNGLATVRLRQRNAAAALAVIGDVTGEVADVIRMHAYGEQLRFRECRQADVALAQYQNRRVVETRALLEAGYLSENAASVRTPDWHNRVFDHECRLLRRHAA